VFFLPLKFVKNRFDLGLIFFLRRFFKVMDRFITILKVFYRCYETKMG